MRFTESCLNIVLLMATIRAFARLHLCEWSWPQGRRIRITSHKWLSFTQISRISQTARRFARACRLCRVFAAGWRTRALASVLCEIREICVRLMTWFYENRIRNLHGFFWCVCPASSIINIIWWPSYNWLMAIEQLYDGEHTVVYCPSYDISIEFDQGKRIIISSHWNILFISSIWHDYLTRISQISQNHTSLSLVCSRPDGKREWNDAFSRDLRDSRETKKLRETGIFL